MSYDAAKLLTMTRAELDALWASADAGPIPNGDAEGTVFVAPGTPYTAEIAQFLNIFAWQGKIFNAEKMMITNKLTVFGLNAVLARIVREPSLTDGKECIVLDYSETSFIAHRLRDEMRLISPGLYLCFGFWNNSPLVYFALQF